MRPRHVLAAIAPILIVATMIPASAETSVEDYVVPVGSRYEVDAVLSVGDDVPETDNTSDSYQMIGIPDGLGAYPTADGAVLFMNHELDFEVPSEPEVGDPLYRGTFVSRYVLNSEGDPVSGGPAYTEVYQDETFVGPTPREDNTTRSFARFCSGFLGWGDVGFDRPIYLTGEEEEGPDTFDPDGGQTVAIFDGEVHALSGFGKFKKENTLVQPGSGNRTVALPLEDGPETPDSQLYLYVGNKDRSPGVTVLERNGLIGGSLYVFRSTTPGKDSEEEFQTGTISGEWVKIPGAGGLSDVELEEASDDAGAFSFVRIEDGAFGTSHRNELFFDTTGGNADAGNELGRLYQLRLGGGNPAKSNAKLRVVYNADKVVENGGDTAISPDNVDVSSEFIAINEDGTSQSRLVMADNGREASIWLFPLRSGPWTKRVSTGTRERVAEVNPPGRDDVDTGTGIWETSGIIDAAGILAGAAWITDIQAHSPTTAPEANTVEDGQLVILRPPS